ncbi:ribonuclease BN [Altererythrobacter sp. B11]|uniref:YihY/virulence factor BrkB family protein n=1 Tax=Altererythrobacter sp. B11 TaxID=2060312 RepID=UPI000DC70BD5|nr:YihY/virulence factor BrkB family protein [Altererythrobacter sp. B11]BBC72800.1 ribonuclease BN [Altererythrobacter sp. B11]
MGRTDPRPENATGANAPSGVTAEVQNGSPQISAGAQACSPWQMPRRAWKQVLKRMYTMWGFHNLSLLGAGVAFFTFLAITPLIAATVMIYGLVGDVGMVRRQMRSIVEVVPSDAASVIERQLIEVVSSNSGVTGLALAVALFFAIYGGMRAASGLIGALNIINEEHETRGFVALTLRAAWLTLAAIMIALTGLVSAGAFAWLQTQANSLIGPLAEFFFKVLAWVASVSLGSIGFALIMRYGPDRRPAKWRWLIPGALLATLLWIAISFGFSLYVAYISDYNATYGSLSAIVVFLMWLFLSAYGVLAGALLNAEIERQTVMDSTVGPDRPAGERGAVLADLVAGDLSIQQWLEKSERRSARRLARKTGHA